MIATKTGAGEIMRALKCDSAVCIVIGVNGLDIYSTLTVDRCWICDSLPTVFQRFGDGLEITVKSNTIFMKLMKLVEY